MDWLNQLCSISFNSWGKEEKKEIHISQVGPTKPLIHSQINEAPLSWTIHLPPFLHGLDKQALGPILNHEVFFFEKKEKKNESYRIDKIVLGNH